MTKLVAGAGNLKEGLIKGNLVLFMQEVLMLKAVAGVVKNPQEVLND